MIQDIHSNEIILVHDPGQWMPVHTTPMALNALKALENPVKQSDQCLTIAASRSIYTYGRAVYAFSSQECRVELANVDRKILILRLTWKIDMED
ncbi:hypothetical protein BgiBS90_025063 [Biomphalaria glabrata]|nr:hypothetical protein BgiBS90_025063 [Biomphalaria glabrata]